MRVPKYRKHSTSRIGFCEWKGHRYYFSGPYNSEQSRSEYRSFLREHVFVDRQEIPAGTDDHVGDSPRSLDGLIERYLDHALEAYQGPHSEYANVRLALSKFKQFSGGTTDLRSIGPKHLKAFQKQLADAKFKRGYINSIVSRVKRAFEWGVSEEIVPVEIHQALATVPGLRAGRTKARETEKKKPVSRKDLDDVLKHLSGPLAAMAEVQWYTGARSDSICNATVDQFDRSVDPWEWRPKHKTQRLGKVVVLPIGPRCQAILKPLMTKRGYIFNPRDVRKNSRYRDHYDANKLGQAITRAIAKANEERVKKNKPLIEHWTPHQLRHTRGTETRKKYGVEATQAVLGHASLKASEIYSQTQFEKAKEVARKHG